MTGDEVLKQLDAFGTAQNRTVYARHGVTGEMFGVSFANLSALKKRIKIDHALAQQLWASGNHDARVLATMIADPQQMTEADLDAWVKDVNNHILADAIPTVAANAPSARRVMEKWTLRPIEFTAAAGWNVLARLSADEAVPDSYFEPCIQRIENQIRKAPNQARHAMNGALIGIGARGGTLMTKALAAAKRIGTVAVDHGETGCKTPDAVEHIQKAASRLSSAPPSARGRVGAR